jgi:hypothetical protein
VKIPLLGARGFVESALLKQALDRGHIVTAIAVREIFFGCSGRHMEARHPVSLGLVITFQFDRNAGILRTKAEGAVNYEAIYTHLIQERNAAGLSWPEIVDARAAALDVTDGEVRALIWLLHSLGEVNDFGPTAVVVSTEVAWGVVRMMGAIGGELTPVAPFWRTEDAEAWFNDRDREKQQP